ncbi:hypothetical protein DRF65_09745 [Chryseobacterium pennae]|uniref:Uncharacterized protein n=1 Tax=Chryseobacterium pennae TaxID=2258962 RepID=A0A3D9CA12_9FLAO|nr:hypothetical protein DRF65_09745 [Chryseobacterium pennae]
MLKVTRQKVKTKAELLLSKNKNTKRWEKLGEKTEDNKWIDKRQRDERWMIPLTYPILFISSVIYFLQQKSLPKD